MSDRLVIVFDLPAPERPEEIQDAVEGLRNQIVFPEEIKDQAVIRIAVAESAEQVIKVFTADVKAEQAASDQFDQDMQDGEDRRDAHNAEPDLHYRDYRDLLVRYMKHVESKTGSAFLDEIWFDSDLGRPEEFTEDEKTILRSLA